MLCIFREKRVSRIISVIILISFLNLVHGCTYYKVHKTSSPPQEALKSFESQKKYIILHSGSTPWHFTQLAIKEDTIIGRIDTVKGHQYYKDTDPIWANQYDDSEGDVLTEVHIYVKGPIPGTAGSTVSFPAKIIDRIETYDRAPGATATRIVGVGGGVVAIIAIIVAATKESCPFIYVDDGTSTKFIGEIYSGAIYPSLERQDYLPLPPPMEGQTNYHIKMTNEVHEIQNTNLIELLVLDHDQDTKVLIDKYGRPQTLSNLESPFISTNLKGTDVSTFIEQEDSLSYFGNDDLSDLTAKDGIMMTFKKPPKATTAKIVVNAKSSYWLDYIFTRFHQLFGKEYTCWVDKQQEISPKKMQKWTIDQDIPMSLYLEKNGKWEYVDYFTITGPMASKEDVLSFDISDINADVIKVKLEYGNLFWDIDYAAMDFTLNQPVVQRKALFKSATDEKENDVKDLLKASDLLYYVQPEPGNQADMLFELPEMADKKRTLILHSQGHYRILLDLEGEQQVGELLKFRKKGHFSEFSNEIFRRHSASYNNIQ